MQPLIKLHCVQKLCTKASQALSRHMNFLLEQSLLGEIKQAGKNEYLWKMVICYLSLEEENPILGNQDVLLEKKLNEEAGKWGQGKPYRATMFRPRTVGFILQTRSQCPDFCICRRWANASCSSRTTTGLRNPDLTKLAWAYLPSLIYLRGRSSQLPTENLRLFGHKLYVCHGFKVHLNMCPVKVHEPPKSQCENSLDSGGQER